MTTRHEKVLLELEDRFSRNALGAAGSAKTLDKSLSDAAVTSRRASRDFDQSSASIDKLSGRLGLLARTAGALGPALVPLTTAAVPAITSLTASLGAAALGAGVVVSAFQGVGDAMDAVNKAQIAPTAENMEKARIAMRNLSPAAREAVRAMQELEPVLRSIRDSAAEGFFPGYVAGLEDLEKMGPQVARIFGSVADAAGDLFDDAAGGLSGPRWAGFIDFIEREAAPTLTQFGHTIGNVATGAASLMMAMDPISDDFGFGLLKASENFAAWAENLSQTDGYLEFIDYVRKTGPQVVETVSSLADALLQIAEAASPLGGPVLRALEGIADAVALIADSPLGPPLMAAVTAMSALSLASKGLDKVMQSTFVAGGRNGGGVRAGIRSFTADLELMASTAMTAGVTTERAAQRAASARRRVGMQAAKVAGGAAAVGAVAGAQAVGVDTTYTMLGAAAGSVIPGIGTAAGAATGAVLDLARAFNAADAAAADFNDAIGSGDLDQITAALDAKRQELEDYVGSDHTFQRILGIFGSDTLPIPRAESVDGQTARLKKELAAAEEARTAALNKEAEAVGFASHAEREHAEALWATADATTSATNAALGYEGALRNMRDATKGVTRAFTEDGQVRHNLTEEQQKAASALLAVGEGWKDLTDAQRAAAGGTKAAREEFVKTAIKLGMSEVAAREYANSLYKVPPRVKTKVETDIEAAMVSLRIFKALYGSLKSKVITVAAQVVPGPMGALMGAVNAAANAGGAGARGSFIHAYAQGGFLGDVANRHLPEIARPRGNMIRVFAEPETQGESYIPHANDFRRPRAMRILEQTAGVMGGSVQWNADGGINGPSRESLERFSAKYAARGRAGGAAETVMRHVVEVRGEMDLERAKAQIEQIAHTVSVQNDEAHETWKKRQGRG